MMRPHRIRKAALAALPALLMASTAMAQEQRSGNFLDNLFNRGESSPQGRSEVQVQRGQAAQSDPGDLSVRLDRMENAMRQMTGTIEQLQYQNQQLQMQLKRMQDDTDYRLQQTAPRGGGGAPPQATPGRRSDVFDPSQQPNVPGSPRALGNGSMVAVQPPIAADEPPIGAPGGRTAGAPLDLSTLSSNPPDRPPTAPSPMTQRPSAPSQMASSQMPSSQLANAAPVSQPASQLPPPRNAGGGGPQVATLPPSASPQDEYDMAYGYILHKDYGLAEQAFRDFVAKHPNERLVPDAQYWLGETLFQRQRYRDAAESFLAVSTKYEGASRAPDSLLRLGQSLSAMNQKEAACATLAEIGRKYPRASASVKRGVTQEQTRAHC